MCAAGINARCRAYLVGMTLLELLVVLVIAALMLALVAPNIGKVLPGAELKGFAQQSAALLRERRSEALVRFEAQTLEVVAEQHSYRLNASEVLPWPDGIQVMLTVAAAPGGSEQGMAAPSLVFYPDGSSSGGTLTLSRTGERPYRIQVEALTGRVVIDG
ncbi:GspH/FimT family pseudopilin [Marinobacterium marinum]|uniref:Type II secretion system protein H n=1 Tax=Marinobacterium marinum TaxID=2756129 RepID=A0A7W1WWM7_9GAMM|nr:GspH/FimT family pseudopilin [Marinobacterium marinum]MBA4501556.1 GspH/FimT family pseudopilin [Marinobacterium marinum]